MRRAIPGGLCVTALGSLLFGLLPSFVSSPLALSIGLICFRCLGGLGAAVSETGCLTVLRLHCACTAPVLRLYCARTCTAHALHRACTAHALHHAPLTCTVSGRAHPHSHPSPLTPRPHQMISTGEALAEEEGHLGVALSSVEVCTGVGAAAGTALGGLLFSLGRATPFGP